MRLELSPPDATHPIAGVEITPEIARQIVALGAKPVEIPTLDPTDAPPGYYAEQAEGCAGCAFAGHGKEECSITADDPNCTAGARKDGCPVIFRKKEDQPSWRRCGPAPLTRLVRFRTIEHGGQAMKATHWSHSDDPEQWMDDPDKRPEDAAERFLIEDDDGAWDCRNELISDGKCEITVYGYRETSDLLPENCWFDGYEPGCTYFAPTGEELVVEVRRTMSVKESNQKAESASGDNP